MVWATIGTTISFIIFAVGTAFVGSVFFVPGVILASISGALPESTVWLVTGILIAFVGFVIYIPDLAILGVMLVFMLVAGAFAAAITFFVFTIFIAIGGAGLLLLGMVFAVLAAVILPILIIAGLLVVSIVGMLAVGVVVGSILVVLSPMILLLFTGATVLGLTVFVSFAFVVIFITAILLSPLALIAVPIWLWVNALTYEGSQDPGTLEVSATNPELSLADTLIDLFLSEVSKTISGYDFAKLE